MTVELFVFYVLAAVTVASGVMVISARNPVHSVLFLILAFFNSAGLFILIGAEFLAMILVVVYVGAVAVLFMFVVMMLDINFLRLQEGFMQYLPVGLLVGERALEARLLDATGKELGFARTAVVFDGTPPTNARFLDLPTRAGKGQPLAVRAACDPPVSGLGEVKFFVGKVEKGQLPPAPPPAPGQLLDAKGNVWAATLAAPKDADRVTVGVRFVSKTGLATIETAEIELVDPAELAKPRPGAIAGKVVEGGLTPDGLPVFLYDAKRAPLAQTKTAGDGTFSFRDLPPGQYVLFARREETNREAMVDVTVAPAAVARPTLELFLRGGP